MTEYKISITKPTNPTSLLSHDNVQAAKEARRKILEAVFQRRRANYIRHRKKMQLQATSDLDTIA